MIPAAFDYTKANTIEEAIAALSDGDAKLLAGGYSLVPAMRMRLSQPARLVDISGIPSLKGVRIENGEIVIAAGTTHYEILTNELVKRHLPFFVQAFFRHSWDLTRFLPPSAYRYPKTVRSLFT